MARDCVEGFWGKDDEAFSKNLAGSKSSYRAPQIRNYYRDSFLDLLTYTLFFSILIEITRLFSAETRGVVYAATRGQPPSAFHNNFPSTKPNPSQIRFQYQIVSRDDSSATLRTIHNPELFLNCKHMPTFPVASIWHASPFCANLFPNPS